MPKRGERKAPAPPHRLEYQAADGAWYDVRLVVVKGVFLHVIYEEFPEEMDEWYDTDLASPRDVAALRASFRVPSPPLDDVRCGDIRAGHRLCVLCAISDFELKYYDAVLDSVRPYPFPSGRPRHMLRF